MTVLAGVVLGLVIGFSCRWWDLPLPAPPRIPGAVLVVLMTLGFIATDAWLAAG